MPTRRETILAALHAGLSVLPATALRGEVLPERVPTAGLMILRDGEPGEPGVTLSPLRHHYLYRAEIEAVVQGPDRDTTFAALCASIGAAIFADRTLGGRCDWIEAEAPRQICKPWSSPSHSDLLSPTRSGGGASRAQSRFSRFQGSPKIFRRETWRCE